MSALIQDQPDPEPPPASCLGKRARRRSSPAPRVAIPTTPASASFPTPTSLATPASLATSASLATPSSPCASTSQLDTPIEPPDADASPNKKKGRPKSSTYKVPWTDEEQRLLERLLQEIPEGESFRWQKISRAMGGKRTPRQVSSRVQKYFEKLKAFGVGDVGEEDEAIDVD